MSTASVPSRSSIPCSLLPPSTPAPVGRLRVQIKNDRPLEIISHFQWPMIISRAISQNHSDIIPKTSRKHPEETAYAERPDFVLTSSSCHPRKISHPIFLNVNAIFEQPLVWEYESAILLSFFRVTQGVNQSVDYQTLISLLQKSDEVRKQPMRSVPISLHRNRYLFISLPNSVSICMTVSLLPTGIFRWASPVSLSVSTMLSTNC